MGETDIFIKAVLVLGKDTIQVDGSHSFFAGHFFALGSQRDESALNLPNKQLVIINK